MGKIFDKSLILNRVKEAYDLSGNSDLARFLGVAPNTITNWYSRNSIDYDIVISKCVNISPDWLITGNGPMYRPNAGTSAPMVGHVPDTPAPQPAPEAPQPAGSVVYAYSDKAAARATEPAQPPYQAAPPQPIYIGTPEVVEVLREEVEVLKGRIAQNDKVIEGQSRTIEGQQRIIEALVGKSLDRPFADGDGAAVWAGD
jgi:hypothetical protein